MVSPGFMNSVLPRCGVKVSCVVWSSGLGGPCGRPSRVMNAKLNGSRPGRARQSWVVLVSGLSCPRQAEDSHRRAPLSGIAAGATIDDLRGGPRDPARWVELDFDKRRARMVA